MKIFLSFLQSPINHPIPAYSFWEHYIKNGIEETGHQWTECPDVDWALGIVPQNKSEHLKWLETTWDKTLNYLKKHPADLFLSYLYPEQIDTEAISEIKKLGIPCVNFFCDNLRLFRKIPAEFAAFDLNWVPENKAIKLYQQAGFPFINLPMPMWVDPKYRTVKEETNNGVTFIGSKDIQRLLFFEKIIQQCPEIPLSIYGNGWTDDILQEALPQADRSKKLIYQYNFIIKNGVLPYSRKLKQRNISMTASARLKTKIQGAISFDEYNKLTAESIITVGINRYPSFHFPLSQPDTYSKLRDIEAPMLGACYLTEQTDGIECMYDIGNEIELYKSTEDFIEKVKELQADAPKRKKLKINGQKRALQDHSIDQSLNKILKRLS
jgi:hypothetical protein